MRTYKHYRPRTVWLPLLLLGAVGLAGVVGLVWSASRGFDTEPPFFVFLLPLGIAWLNIWMLGGNALEVRLDDSGQISFHGPLRNIRIPVLDIQSITPSAFSNAPLFVLRHRHGTIRFDPRLNGMHELIAELRRQNPAIELTGI